jgi:hypothetical protein
MRRCMVLMAAVCGLFGLLAWGALSGPAQPVPGCSPAVLDGWTQASYSQHGCTSCERVRTKRWLIHLE